MSGLWLQGNNNGRFKDPHTICTWWYWISLSELWLQFNIKSVRRYAQGETQSLPSAYVEWKYTKCCMHSCMMFLTVLLYSKSFPTNGTHEQCNYFAKSLRSGGNILQCCMHVSKMFLTLSFEMESFVTKIARTWEYNTFLQALEVSFDSWVGVKTSILESTLSFRYLWGIPGFTGLPSVLTNTGSSRLAPALNSLTYFLTAL